MNHGPPAKSHQEKTESNITIDAGAHLGQACNPTPMSGARMPKTAMTEDLGVGASAT